MCYHFCHAARLRVTRAVGASAADGALRFVTDFLFQRRHHCYDRGQRLFCLPSFFPSSPFAFASFSEGSEASSSPPLSPSSPASPRALPAVLGLLRAFLLPLSSRSKGAFPSPSRLSSGVSLSASTSLAARGRQTRTLQNLELVLVLQRPHVRVHVQVGRPRVPVAVMHALAQAPQVLDAVHLRCAEARLGEYVSALSALAALTELARGYLHRKHESLPRKLCAPHFWQLQSPCFHLELELPPAPPPAAFSIAFSILQRPYLVILPLALGGLVLLLSFLLLLHPAVHRRRLVLGLGGFPGQSCSACAGCVSRVCRRRRISFIVSLRGE